MPFQITEHGLMTRISGADFGLPRNSLIFFGLGGFGRFSSGSPLRVLRDLVPAHRDGRRSVATQSVQ